MKSFNIKKSIYRYGDLDHEILYRFRKENDRDEYLDILIEQEIKDGYEVDKGTDSFSVYHTTNDKWAFSYEKDLEEIKFMKLPKKK